MTSDFIWQTVWYLLQFDLTYIATGGFAVLVVCWLIRFLITLIEDREDG